MVKSCRDKKKTTLLLIVVLVFTASTPALAGVGVTLNGQPLEFSSMEIYEGTLFVSADALAHYMEGSISYDPFSTVLRFFAKGSMIQMRLGEQEAKIKGETVDMGSSPFLLDERVLIPLRFIMESYKAMVSWNEEDRVVEIVMDEEIEEVQPYAGDFALEYTPEEFDLLVRCISSEAGDQPYEGMVAVGAVVINRALNSRFPNTIHDVIYQPGQFSVVGDNRINLPVKDGAHDAAMAALKGEDPTGGALYFYNPVKARASFVFTRRILTVIGDHRFCD